MKMVVCIVVARSHRNKYKSDVMNAMLAFVKIVIGVMNFKPIMKYEYVIDVMPFIVVIVMKWINAMIVPKWCVPRAVHYCRVNFVEVDSVRSVLRHVDGTCVCVYVCVMLNTCMERVI
jgi:hypothetical protein